MIAVGDVTLMLCLMVLLLSESDDSFSLNEKNENSLARQMLPSQVLAETLPIAPEKRSIFLVLVLALQKEHTFSNTTNTSSERPRLNTVSLGDDPEAPSPPASRPTEKDNHMFYPSQWSAAAELKAVSFSSRYGGAKP